MSRSFDRQLRHAAQQFQPEPEREPEPDFTGWKNVDVVKWKLDHGYTLQQMVRAANASAEEKPDKGTEPEREAVDVKATLPRLEAEPKPASAEAEPEAKPKRKRREPGQPRPKRQWWEENARWRLREPQDDDRPRRPLNQCIHEYDPLTYDEEG